MINLKQIANKLLTVTKNPYFGFIDDYQIYNKNEISTIERLIKKDDEDINIIFESNFSKIIGNGSAVSFASARMGFYAVLKSLKIKQNDEVIIQGATCAVMINAIIRIGAKPVFVDIDPYTFGSSAIEISKAISSKTKIIVAQHSFGIPCNIEEICELANSKGIFLIEDCALTVSSKINKTICGNFGDAAIFSTDHSKPINLLIGGLVYTKKESLYKKLLSVRNNSKNLDKKKRIAIYKQILFERKNSDPSLYGKGLLKASINRKRRGYVNPFLDADNTSSMQTKYPYPAKLPSFLAFMGIKKLQSWDNIISERKKFLQDFLNLVDKKNSYNFSVYYDKKREIVPLRIAWAPNNGNQLRSKLSSFVDVSWTWFMSPIVATNEPLINFGYNENTCPISEEISEKIVNIPCNLRPQWSKILLEYMKNSIFNNL